MSLSNMMTRQLENYEGKYSEVERYLFSYRDAVRERDAIRTKLEVIEEEMMPKSPSLSGMPGGGDSGDRMADYIARVEEYSSKLKLAYDKAYREMMRVDSVINLVEDPFLRQLMTYRYIKGYKWEVIADSMQYSEQRIFQLRLDALREASKILDDCK